MLGLTSCARVALSGNPVHALDCVNRDLTQLDGWKTKDGRMMKKHRGRPGMHSLATFFRHSAVLSLPAVLLREVSTVCFALIQLALDGY